MRDRARDRIRERRTRVTELTKATCVPCQGGVPTLTDSEIKALKGEVPLWKVVRAGGIKRLRREFTFPDFAAAIAFAYRVGEIAEEEQHHPDLHVAWGKVVVETWTHKIGGLHRNDFILAAKVDKIPGA
jgi:4a-hydroxytetrahydrobiopterin dehydratase